MKIFIVEDEPWALEELIDMLSVYEKNHQLFAFPSGDDALNESDRLKPDLVITDIRMPGVDGLQLIEELKKKNPDVQGIVISGYDEFTYARKGLKIGIKDYLLKPVMPEQLYDSVDRIIDSIKELNQKMNTLRRWKLSRILLDPAETPTLENLDFVNQAWGIVLIICGNFEGLRTWSEIEPSLNFSNRPIGSFTSFPDEINLDIDSHRKAILFPLSGSLSLDVIKKEAGNLFEKFVKIGEVVHATYYVKAAGEPICKTFKTAHTHLEQHIRLEFSTFIEPGVKASPVDLRDIWDQVRILEQYIRTGDVSRVREKVNEIIERLKELQLTINQLTEFITDLFYGLHSNLNLGFDQNEFCFLDEIFKLLKQSTHYDQISDWVLDKLVTLTASNQLAQSSSEQIVQNLIEFINKNYNKNISLQDFSAAYHISIGYLSRLFKSEIGVNFSDYLRAIRLTKAKEILQNGQHKLSDVSAIVGYEDPKYFSQLFKKEIGVSPSEFQKRQMN